MQALDGLQTLGCCQNGRTGLGSTVALTYRAMHAQRITILGVGLLGGSIGLAAKSVLSDCKIIGYGHRASTLKKAMECGAIDEGQPNLLRAVDGSDLVILCTPVGMFAELLRDMADGLAPDTVVTDVGSTKRSVVRMAEDLLPSNIHFIGSHPMAGSEKRGVEFARTDLFQNALCLVTPTPQTDAHALAKVQQFWKSIGMRIARLSPHDHDRLLADISHLPHALAACLIAMQHEAGLDLAGKGFLDTTRIGSGDANLWRDILLDNRDNLRGSLSRLRDQLRELEHLLEDGDREELARWLDKWASRRTELMKRKLREVEG
jgi:prephenate dehydrogenase